MSVWAEYARFFGEFRREFQTTGAILPSGPFLAFALTRPLRGRRTPWRILEVGPGTGAVTQDIVRRMIPGDLLHAVEINPRFATLLAQRINREHVFAPHRDSIEIICAGVEDLPGESIYDLIVSGLPLNNFAPAQVRSIFATFTRLVRPGGLLSWFEYAIIRQLTAPFVNRQERRRLSRIGRLVGGFVHRHQVRSEPIFVNVPPAIVRQLCLKPTDEMPARRRRTLRARR
jgi:phospholipid N-methyltransferase